MVGGLVKKIFQWMVQKPIRTGSIAGLFTVPWAFFNALDTESSNALYYGLYIASPMFSFLSAFAISDVLYAFTYEDKHHPRTRLGDFSKRKKIKQDLSKTDFEGLVKKEYKKSRQSSIRSVFNQTKKPFVSETQKGTDQLVVLAEKMHDPVMHAEAAVRFFQHSRYDDALIQIGKLLRLEQTLPVISTPDISLRYLANYIDIVINPRDPLILLNAALLESFKQNYGKALYYSSFAQNAARAFNSPIKKEVYCLDALVHHAVDAKNSQDVWAGFINEIKKEPVLERIAETKNPVRVLKSSKFLSKTIVFKDTHEKDDLLAEKDMTLYIGKIIEDKFSVAEPLYITDKPINKVYTYVMRHADGQTLLDQFKQNDFSALSSAVDCLALIHAEVPQDKVRKGRLRIAWKLRKKLLSKDLGIPKKLAKKIINAYRPVYDTFKKAIYVYNKDAHPENWLVNDKIVVLDCENGFLVPMQFDLVNLLEYSDYLSDKQKDDAIKSYVNAYSIYSDTKLDLEQFRLVYFNAVINRAISLCTAWSSKDRSSMHSERIKVVNNAINAINRLRKEYNDYYTANSADYSELSKSLAEIQELVSV